MRIALDKSKEESLYLQIYRSILGQIMDGQLTVGQKLPSYRWMCQKYNINISTVEKAYQLLEEEGAIQVIHGSGCYVRPLDSYHFFADEVILEAFDRGQITDSHRINFASATPLPRIYPVADFQNILQEIAGEDVGDYLKYPPTQGHPALLSALEDRLRAKGIALENQQLQVVNGSQQGLDILCKSLISSHSRVLAENPSYPVSLNAFLNCGATLDTIPLEEDGPEIKELESILARKKIDFFYTMINFQSPTNICWSRPKKEALLRLAEAYNFLIIEDDCMGEIYFGAAGPESLKSLDTRDRVIYLNSFSKNLMPGIRLAYLLYPAKFSRRILSAKFHTDLSCGALQQELLARYLGRGLFEGHLEKVRDYYREKQKVMARAIKKSRHMQIVYDQPGGLFYWVALSEKISSFTLYEEMKALGVALLPGSMFSIDGRWKNYLRLSYASASSPEIRRGLGLLDEKLAELTTACEPGSKPPSPAG
ncbi:MAG: PLP-dependent aminotransferase family protein [Peptococcaceae bacterium]|nr:PLP-dependent aminotransferase family protein [Peptococcaceae bacterium]